MLAESNRSDEHVTSFREQFVEEEARLIALNDKYSWAIFIQFSYRNDRLERSMMVGQSRVTLS
jgi:hypothetical protein